MIALCQLWTGEVVARNEVADILSHREGLTPIDYSASFKRLVDKERYIGNFTEDMEFIEQKLSKDLEGQRSGMQACGFYGDKDNVDHIITMTMEWFNGFDFTKYKDYLMKCNAAIAKNGGCREGVLWVFKDSTQKVTMVLLTYETNDGKIVLAQKLE